MIEDIEFNFEQITFDELTDILAGKFNRINKENAYWLPKLGYYYPADYLKLIENSANYIGSNRIMLPEETAFKKFQEAFNRPFFEKDNALVTNEKILLLKELFFLLKSTTLASLLAFSQKYPEDYPTLAACFEFRITNNKFKYLAKYANQSLLDQTYQYLLKTENTDIEREKLHWLVKFNQLEELKRLYTDASHSDLITVLLNEAALWGHKEMVMYFLSILHPDKRKEAILKIGNVIAAGEEEMAVTIIKGGNLNALVEGTAKEVLASLFFDSISNDQTHIFEFILKHFPDIKNTLYNAHTAVTHAINVNKIKTLKRLIDAGANINNDMTSQHKSPLTYAIGKNNIEIVELLVKSKANLNEIDGRGFTPLQCAAVNRWSDLSQRDKCIKLLLKHGSYRHTLTNAFPSDNARAITQIVRNCDPNFDRNAELDAVLMQAESLSPREKAITLLTWYKDQPFYTHQFHHKQIVTTMLHELTSQIDETLTMLEFQKIKVSAFDNYNDKGFGFLKKMKTEETINQHGHLKGIFEKIANIIESEPVYPNNISNRSSFQVL